MKRNQQKAYSLLELLVAVGIIGLLLAIAIPSFSKQVQKTRQKIHVHEMLATLHFTRSEAVTRRTTVSLCDSHQGCESRHWRSELVVFTDSNQNGRLDEGEIILRKTQIAPSYSWNWSNFRNQNHIAFRPSGMTHSLNGTFTLCHENTAKRQIVINFAGRARLESPSDNSRCD